jgi:hypothetical protein
MPLFPLSSALVALLLLITIEATPGARRRRSVEEQQQHEQPQPHVAGVGGEHPFNGVGEAIDPISGNLVLEPINNGGYEFIGGSSNGGGSSSNSNEHHHVDNRRYSTIDDAAAAVGTHAAVLFSKLLRILAAMGVFLFVLLLAVLASVYVDRVLTLLGVRANYVFGTVFVVDAFIVFGGLFFALEILNIDPGEIFIGMGLLSYALIGVVGKTATEVFSGFVVKIDPAYDVGQEISVLSNRYRGIIHSKLLTEIVIELAHPALSDQSAPTIKSVRPTGTNAAGGAQAIMIEEVEEVQHMRVSYSQFLAEERIFHKYHKTYVPAKLRGRSSMGVHLDGPNAAKKNRDN